MARPTLFLLDGSSQVYRAYHAFRGKGLSNEEGQSTHAVLVFVNMLRNLIAEYSPQYIAAAFDLEGPTFRDDLVDDYKATREAMPDDLAEQMDWVHEACEALGVPVITAPGFEADDVIGTLAAQATKEGCDVAIVSIDKDFFQLVGNGVRIYDPRDGGTWLDAPGVQRKFGVVPAQVVDVLALVGDASDNVSGVPGVGKKGAIALLESYGSLERLLAAAGDLPQKKYREALTAHHDLALRSRELVTIRTDVPLDTTLESLRYVGPSRERCHALFSRLSFRTLTNEFAPSAEHVERDYVIVSTPDALDALIDEARTGCAVQVVGDAPSGVRGDVAGIAISTAESRARFIPLAQSQGADLLSPHDATPRLEAAEALRRLRPLLEDPAIPKTGHDLKYTVTHLARLGITLNGLAFDAMLGSYVLNATRKGGHTFESLTLEELGFKAKSETEVRGRGNKLESLAAVAPEVVLAFAAERADLAGQLSRVLQPRVKQEGVEEVLTRLELPLIPVLADIERAGIRVDASDLARLSSDAARQMKRAEQRIFEIAGAPFNLNSPKQMAEMLFDKLQLPAGRRTGKTRTASTAVGVLEKLAAEYEIAGLILEWRGLTKLKSTYIDTLPTLVNSETGRIHTSFNQAVAATGRLTSSDPNLQNIPVRTALGREIRGAFVASPEYVLVSADYSQIELRVLAHLADDSSLIHAFRNNEDIHDRTAAKVFGADSALDPHELRRRAKIINYALLYGKTAYTLASDIGVSTEEAQAFIDAYFEGFPLVRAYIDRTLAESRESGMVKTMFGRRRLVPGLTSHNAQERAATERETVNMPIQGTAADILKLAMITLHAALRASSLRARMILTVHDELLLEVHHADQEATIDLVREHMEGAASLAVPLTVDVGVGSNWRDAKS